jgi:dinuclear metal center YbgI/SA1388 family protein
MPTVADVVSHLEKFAPRSLAAEWDNVGLLLGDGATPVARVLTCLTVTPGVVAEAVAGGVNLIVTHHPVLFRAVKSLTTATAEGRILLPLVRNGVAVYSPHTAFDDCAGGINDQLCETLGLTDVRPLRSRPVGEAGDLKLVVFVPVADLAKVSDALFAAGAGRIGAYRECSFRTEGTGTFFGTDDANPAVGQKMRREEVSESRLEVVVPTAKVAAAVAALRAAHSYEEPAFDLYPLKTAPAGGSGRVGVLPQPVALGDLGRTLRTKLRANGVQVIGDQARPVSRVAVACGAAGEYLKDAIKAQADIFVTGELRFHDGLAAQAAGVAVLLPGHYATERSAVEALAGRLQAAFPDVTVTASAEERDPFDVLP